MCKVLKRQKKFHNRSYGVWETETQIKLYFNRLSKQEGKSKFGNQCVKGSLRIRDDSFLVKLKQISFAFI